MIPDKISILIHMAYLFEVPFYSHFLQCLILVASSKCSKLLFQWLILVTQVVILFMKFTIFWVYSECFHELKSLRGVFFLIIWIFETDPQLLTFWIETYLHHIFRLHFKIKQLWDKLLEWRKRLKAKDCSSRWGIESSLECETALARQVQETQWTI